MYASCNGTLQYAYNGVCALCVGNHADGTQEWLPVNNDRLFGMCYCDAKRCELRRKSRSKSWYDYARDLESRKPESGMPRVGPLTRRRPGPTTK